MKIPQTPIHFFTWLQETGQVSTTSAHSPAQPGIPYSNLTLTYHNAFHKLAVYFVYEQTFDVFPSPRSHNSHPLQTCSIHDT